MPLCVLSYILLLYCQLPDYTESLTFEVLNNVDSRWTFEEGSNVLLVCTNSPYTGVLTFEFNSTEVYGCTGSLCTTIGSNQEHFSFKSDTDTGVFTWTIHDMRIKYNGKQFTCRDGLNNITHTATVMMKEVSTRSSLMVYVIASSVVAAVVSAIIVIILVFCIKRKYHARPIERPQSGIFTVCPPGQESTYAAMGLTDFTSDTKESVNSQKGDDTNIKNIN